MKQVKLRIPFHELRDLNKESCLCRVPAGAFNLKVLREFKTKEMLVTYDMPDAADAECTLSVGVASDEADLYAAILEEMFGEAEEVLIASDIVTCQAEARQVFRKLWEILARHRLAKASIDQKSGD